MGEREITRRSMLAASAGVLAGGLMRPGAALAAVARPPSPATGPGAAPRLFWRSLGSVAAGAQGASVDLRANADLLGVSYRAGPRVRVQLRFRTPAGRWGAWVAAGPGAHGPDGGRRSPATIGDPVWTGGTDLAQVRADGALGDVRIACIDVSAGAGARRLALAGPAALDASLPLAMPTLAAGPGQPPILARRAWAQGMARPRVAPAYGAVRMAFVHHTENPNGYSAGEVPAMLRAIFAFHRYVRGWNDIGYNFVIDLYGRIFEARAGGIDEPVVGAQAGGYNTESTGVAVLGEFMSTPISPAAAAALERLLAWKLSLHGVPSLGRVTVRVDPAGASYTPFRPGQHVSLPRVAGHRDGDNTDCPGDVLYAQLPDLRPRIHRLAGRPAQLTLELAGQAPVIAPGAPAQAGATAGAQLALAGTFSLLDGTPVVGASVLVQARSVAERGELVSEQTLARAVTGAGGAWSATVDSAPAAAASWLRALCPGGAEGGAGGAGATVSGQLRVAGAVTGAPAAPPTPEAPAPPAS